MSNFILYKCNFFCTYLYSFIIYCILLLQTSNLYKSSYEFNFVLNQFDTFYLDYSLKEIITNTGTYLFFLLICLIRYLKFKICII